MVVVKLIGAAVLVGVLAVALLVGDIVANQGRLFYAVMGRDTLVSLCAPQVRDSLVKRGFSPSDLEFGDQPSISFASGTFGRTRTLTSPFTFSDGPNGLRVDGNLVCVVSGTRVTVDVDVDGLPVRAA